MKRLVIGFAIVVAFDVQAQTAVINPPGGELKVNTSARGAGKTTEVLVDNTTVTNMPATPLAYRKAVELQNLGPNPIYCTIGGETPLTTGALGRKVESQSSWEVKVGPGIIIKCLAGTADQVTTAATQVSEAR